MHRIVTPEQWYIVFWVCMGLGFLVLQGVVTCLAVYLALKWSGR